MSYYSVLDVSPTSDSWIPAYIPTASKLVTKHGGKYLARTATHEQVEGQEQPAALRVVIEWPSKQAAQDFMGDPEYAQHLANRTNGSISNHYLIAAQDDMA